MGVFKPDGDGFKALAVSEDVRAAVAAEAERGKGLAVAMSEDFRVTGEYAESFRVESTVTTLRTRFGEHPVAAAQLANTSDHAAAVEWGNRHDHEPHHVLGKTLEALSHE